MCRPHHLSAAAIVGERSIVDATGEGVEHADLPAVFTFGGYDGVRMHDDLRALSLHGMAAHGAKAEVQRHDICNPLLLANATGDIIWHERCMVSSLASTAWAPDNAGGTTDACTLSLVLQRAWCTEEYQSIGNL